MATTPDANPSARRWTSWIDTLNDLPSTEPPTEDLLDAFLRVCLADEHWAEQPEETDLHAFLALCWPYPALQLQVQDAMQYWSKERRALLAECIRPHLQKASRPSAAAAFNGMAPSRDSVLQPWRDDLITKKNGDPLATLSNIGLILTHGEQWAGTFWWDAVRGRPMYHDDVLSDDHVVEVAQWLGTHERMGVNNTRPVEQCILRLAREHPRDLLQTWLNELPAWDGTPRLTTWLTEVAGAPSTAYGQAVARLLPISLVARAIHPGCLYRYVVILEGAENTGKSTLVRTLAGEGWYVELSGGLESKEAHMLLQGTWVAELAELDSLSRTEETRLKAFLTLTEDTWIPKYSNLRISIPRRTVFIGTSNDTDLKGETGNTRFLPLPTSHVDIPAFEAMREQLFAEASVAYHLDTQRWWALPDDALEEADAQRESRRVLNVYEDSLYQWLLGKDETTWPEIAQGFLQLHKPSDWSNKMLQMQIASALKLLGWKNKSTKRGGRSIKIWCRNAEVVAGGSEVVTPLPY